MQTKAVAALLAGTLLAAWPCEPTFASAASQREQINIAKLGPNYLSANIPLDSYVYAYLDKLDGLGYLEEMRPTAKPYTRMQASIWVQHIGTKLRSHLQAPAYAEKMLAQLEHEFRSELAILDGRDVDDGLELREWRISAGHYDGDMLTKERPKVDYQPLNYNNDGFKYDDGFNLITKLRFDGKTGKDLLISLTPRFANATDNQNDTSLAAGYIKTRINNVEIQLGKDALWWGPGKNGTLALSNNAEPQTGLILRNIEPLHFNGVLRHLGAITNTVVYSELEDDRTDVVSASFLGWRSDFVPSSNFTFGFARTSMLGGKGHSLHSSDWWDFITGENAWTDDKWNSIGGIDFRWRLPQLNGLQIYGEVYGEDQAKAAGFIPTPSKTAYIAGAYLPRLTRDGEWDLTLEWAKTANPWYVHGLYREGYTHKGDIIGDAVGRDATRYYVKLTNYQSHNAELSLHYQYSGKNSGTAPQSIDSTWLSWHRILPRDYSVDLSLGVAQVDNANEKSGEHQDNYFAGLTVTKQF